MADQLDELDVDVGAVLWSWTETHWQIECFCILTVTKLMQSMLPVCNRALRYSFNEIPHHLQSQTPI